MRQHLKIRKFNLKIWMCVFPIKIWKLWGYEVCVPSLKANMWLLLSSSYVL